MNADDRLSLDPLGPVEGGNRIVEGSHVADVCPQPTNPDSLVVVLALAISLIPRSSHSEEPIKMTVTLAGKMKEGTDWVDTKILCDSHGNEIVVVKNREQGLGSTNMQ